MQLSVAKIWVETPGLTGLLYELREEFQETGSGV